MGIKQHMAGNGRPMRSSTYARTDKPPERYKAPLCFNFSTIHPFRNAANKYPTAWHMNNRDTILSLIL
jgi:hypothetical protein